MGDIGSLTVLAVIVLLAVIVAFSSLRIANEYERGVVFRLGRLIPLKGPGLFFIIPFGIDRLVKMDLRVITLEVPPQEIITNDNVTAKVNAVIYFQVVDARRAVTQVLNYINATSQIAQTTLRAALGQATLDELLANREKINQNLQKIIDEQTEPWGIKVAVVEIKDVELPSTMQRAMAKQAEAEREKRARSSTPTASSRLRRRWPTPPRSSHRRRAPSSCDSCRPWWRSVRRRTRPSSFPSPSS